MLPPLFLNVETLSAGAVLAAPVHLMSLSGWDTKKDETSDGDGASTEGGISAQGAHFLPITASV